MTNDYGVEIQCEPQLCTIPLEEYESLKRRNAVLETENARMKRFCDELKWISVKDRLPMKGQYVIVAGTRCSLYPIDIVCWSEVYIKNDAVHHWMLLPPLPTTDESSATKRQPRTSGKNHQNKNNQLNGGKIKMGIHVELTRNEIKKMANEPNLTWREKALIDYILRMFKANAKLNEENDNYKKTLISFYSKIQKKYPFVSETVKKQDEENAKFVIEKAKAMFPPMSAPMMNPPFDGKENAELGKPNS